MYTYFPRAGVIIRNADGLQVAPSSDTASADYLAWLAWSETPGNAPALGQDPPESPRVISKLEFRRRFTMAERVAIDNSPDSPAVAAQYRPALRTILKDFELAEYINLDDPLLGDSLAFFAGAGLLSADRIPEILA
jgi:hypothetical protein